MFMTVLSPRALCASSFKVLHCAQHRLDGVVQHSDRVMVMEQGKVVEQGIPSELLHRPGSAFANLYRAARSDLKG